MKLLPVYRFLCFSKYQMLEKIGINEHRNIKNSVAEPKKIHFGGEPKRQRDAAQAPTPTLMGTGRI
jgi:hypothetical protein